MPTFGGFSPFPLRFGGGKRRLEVIYDSINESLGSAYDTSDSSTVTSQTMAEARAIDAAYSGNVRMSYATDPLRMPTELVPRWETILDLHPHRTDSIEARRAALAAKFLSLSGGTILEDTVRALTGASFIAIEFTALADAVPRWPVNGFADKWTSNVAHFVIRVQFAPNQTNADFWNMRARLRQFLRDFVPAWVTFDIAISDSHGTECFYLDEPDLDLLTFCS
jgi:hypothetical protein